MNVTLIGIAGGSGSGKSTFTNRLKSYFQDDISIVYHDNYYRRQDNTTYEQRVKVNYDHPDALETELLIQHLKALKQGQDIYCPVYDFVDHNRSNETVLVKSKPVILVEGIMLFENDELRDMFDMKIYVDSDADERILRRILRDVEQRGRDLNSVITQYLNTVKPMHALYVEPTRQMADVVINSGMNDVAFDVVCNYIKKILNEANL
ncbi:MAG: uridine kinase [Erysipelotrichaceae bacterium]|uniref:uridine kinase n=1 Tax=Floccifex sp. TaxID=2815810 RepID=UPI002A74F242|nr:uridine kinase [Floccifex sp.]MDD7281214.1 uridine kinase [Erysipelotrichaceae bacterium]MDY2958248.1 uridine kinase [Floccifex sp.]